MTKNQIQLAILFLVILDEMKQTIVENFSNVST
jgi:hypothetical protein